MVIKNTKDTCNASFLASKYKSIRIKKLIDIYDIAPKVNIPNISKESLANPILGSILNPKTIHAKLAIN